MKEIKNNIIFDKKNFKLEKNNTFNNDFCNNIFYFYRSLAIF